MTRHHRHFSRRNILIIAAGSVILATVAMAAFGFLPGVAAFTRSPHQPGASRLGRGEITRLLSAAGSAGLTFEPYQGRRRCCDLGDPTLHLYADGRAVVDANGFVLDERVGKISITADGKLEWLTEDAALAQWLRSRDLQTAEFYRQGQSLFLIKAGSSFPDLPMAHPGQWPFKIARDSLERIRAVD